MKKLVYFLISLLVLLVCTGIGYVYVLYNLSANSIYYAHHMPHAKGTNPEMAMVVDHLFWQKEPKDSQLDITYRYFDGFIAVKNLDMYNVYMSDSSIFYENGYELYKTNQSLHETYYATSSGKFTNYIGRTEPKESRDNRLMTTAEKTEAQKLVDTIMKPIIASQKKPIINLQQLFNAKYQKRFSK